VATAPEIVASEPSSEALFDELLGEALESPDIANNLDSAHLSADELREEVAVRRGEIMRSFAPELDAYAAAVRDFAVTQADLPPLRPPEPPPTEKGARLKGPRRPSPKGSMGKILESPEREERQRELSARRAELDAAGAHLRHILSGAVSEALRSALNSHLSEPALETRLHLQGTEGLAQVVDRRLEIPTRAAEQLGALLRRMKGGSVGVSGPRGAGKTTLLNRFCEGREVIGDKPAKAVLVPAPVAYDSREFLSHLADQLCRELGGKLPEVAGKDVDETDPAWHWPAGAGRLLLLALAIAAPLAALAGVAGLVSSLQSALTDQLVWGVATVLGGLALLLIATPMARWLYDAHAPRGLLNFLPRLIAFSGLGFVAGGAALVVADLVGDSASGTAIRAGALLLGALAVIAAARPVFRASESAGRSFADDDGEPDTLVTFASNLLEDITYQQSYARGWSLGAGFGSMQGGISADTSLARQTMTYPELVSRLRGLLSLAAQNYDVVIGIDELDKLESGPTADRFLNELKAMFGVPGTYFLVSVSEDAMSRFERRGLPFRDVFDSTFDEIVRVQPLSLGEAQQLLDKRVVGLPLIYSGLCHVLSGGLPRDLIRTARRLVEIHDREGHPDTLGALTGTLLGEELGMKADAVRFAARTESPPEPLLANFVDWLGKFRNAGADPAELVRLCEEIEELATTRLPAANLDADGRTRRSSVLRMGLELACYGYFAATVLEVFHDGLTPTDIRLAADGTADEPALEALAQAHAGFVVNPNTAWFGINSYRTTASCDPPAITLSPTAIV
jgi:hypothetical protein